MGALLRVACTLGLASAQWKGVVSQEDIDNHNKEGGLWIIINNRVYDVQSLATQVWPTPIGPRSLLLSPKAPCGEERLRGLAGKDASIDFNMVGHSECAKEMAKHFLVGEYQEVCVCVGGGRQGVGRS